MKNLINKYVRQPICQLLGDTIIKGIELALTEKQRMQYFGMGLMLDTYAIYHGFELE